MTDKKIIFFDIDRTLYDPDTRSIPVSTIEALKKLHDDPSVEIAIATGRAFYMLHNVEEIKEYINIYILINGQIIIKDGVTIFKNPIPKKQVLEVVENFNKNNMKYGFLGEFDETLNIVDDKGKEAFELVDMKLPKIDPHFYKDNEIFQMWAFCERDEHDYFKKEFKDLEVVRWLGGGFDVLSKGMSKREGIKKVLEIEGIPLENSYAFGDGDNDIEMLDYIPKSVAMGNASKRAKEHARYLTNDIKDDGVRNGLIALGLLDD
ncbi:Putative bifunctional phosphatase/peptidyl-prolyl cis-trans isomerase [Candidatus Izimaplasma bacterium HR1]|jgi:Cof subfamily protein (haloacid dehalogenase superfamily)|uniref:Cof-type HAD-IIB family hydrolase n=1 Tax=Candidatus Izimoplasma sp. HR1 TaxID=1541959 RepID=UPI0004F6AA2F|nr:Putative bifunctional phosphatase/peptidyl-prolyl cis-trans isomerase [Candidatus Izimaplasma bacterium HR1]